MRDAGSCPRAGWEIRMPQPGEMLGAFSPIGSAFLLQLQQERCHFGLKGKPSAYFPELEKVVVTATPPLQA